MIRWPPVGWGTIDRACRRRRKEYSMSSRRPRLSICLIVVLLLSSFVPTPAFAMAPASLAAPAAQDIPISQGKPAFASSSPCGDGGGCLTPDYANDGLDWT